MTSERLNLDMSPDVVFADQASRRIRGTAIPLGATATKAGRTWKFLKDSVKFGPRTPLLQFHDPQRPVGLLASSRWTDRGLEVEFAVSRTTAGDEVLQLAHDGVLGLSVGIEVAEGGAKFVGEEVHVTSALAPEVSLTPLPAFAGASIDHVALSAANTPERTPEMPDDNTTTTTPVGTATNTAGAVTVNLDAQALGQAIAAGLAPATSTTSDGPVPQPVPTTTTTSVNEAAPYCFTGTAGRYGFVADAYDAFHGNAEAAQRLNTFLRESFVTQANVTALNPTQQRPDLYQGPLRYERPLSDLITTGTIADNTPFVLPKFNSAGTLVAPHVEGVEPALGTWTATSQTVTPTALSSKIEITRETWDARGNPAVDQLVWNEMLAAHAQALEERVAATLDGLTLTPIAITGNDTAVVDALTSELVALQFEKGGNRYSGLALNQDLYTALVNSRDADGRALLPVLGPTNAQGQVTNNFGRVMVGNAVGVPAWGLDAYSYLLVPTSVYLWTSPVQRLTFDVQIKSIYLGAFAYAASAVIRDSDVKRISWAAA